MTPAITRGSESSYRSAKVMIVGHYRHDSDSMAGGILSRGNPTYVAPSRKSTLTRHNYYSITIVP